MSEYFVKLASLYELSTSKLMRVKAEKISICLAYVEGTIYAVDDMCTHEAAGNPVDLSVEEATARPGKGSIGWAYVDQQAYCPALHILTDLRTQIVKRQAITTVEVLTKPVSGKIKTHFMSGYVHTPYTPAYAMLARHAGFHSYLMIRGVEGGIIPSLRQRGKMFYYHDMGAEQAQEFDPTDIGIQQDVHATPLPDDLPERPAGDDVGAAFDTEEAAGITALNGLCALDGDSGSTYDALVYAGAIALWHLKKHDKLQDAAAQIRDVLDSGEAMSHFESAKV